MPMQSSMVGKESKRFRHVAERRWLMAYAASLGDTADCYFDTAKSITSHPVFVSCPEWPVILDARKIEGAASMTPDEARRGVHATHQVTIHRPIREDEEIFTRARIIGIEQRKSGAFMLTQLDTESAEGEPIITTYHGGLSRGVKVTGDDKSIARPPEIPSPTDAPKSPVASVDIPIAAGAAHVYTECARIFNPIHTDRAVALAAGLPDIILHGTATLAIALSKLIEHLQGGDPSRVRAYACRFTAMVLMPSIITLNIEAREDGKAWFSVRNAEGEAAISDGYLAWE